MFYLSRERFCWTFSFSQYFPNNWGSKEILKKNLGFFRRFRSIFDTFFSHLITGPKFIGGGGVRRGSAKSPSLWWFFLKPSLSSLTRRSIIESQSIVSFLIAKPSHCTPHPYSQALQCQHLGWDTPLLHKHNQHRPGSRLPQNAYLLN